MNTISVTADRDYEVVIDIDWQKAIEPYLTNRGQVAVIVSEAMRDRIVNLPVTDAQIHIFTVPDSEAGKSFATYQKVLDWLGAAGFTRNDLIVAVGGGAVTDLSGFVASSWLRGIDWVAVPTTLAAMVDAAVGGKTGINSEYGKNLIGAFHSPRKVIIDSKWLKTLSSRDIAAGLAEVIKTGFIGDQSILDLMQNFELERDRNNYELLNELIEKSVTVKAGVVSSDFKESFAREALNYGHTLGHAIEKYSKYQMRHGEAVAIGMVFIAELASARSLIDAQTVQMHRDLLTRYELPTTFERSAWQKLAPLLSLDKKARGNTIRFVALDGIGSTLRLDDLTSDELDAAYERISS